MIVSVSSHALDRYVERIGGDRAKARAAMSRPVFRRAADFGARIVRIGRCRAVLQFTGAGAIVVTVVPIDHLPRQLIPQACGGPPFVCRDPDFQQHKERSHAA